MNLSSTELSSVIADQKLYAKHVHPSKGSPGSMLMGERSGAKFRNVLDGRWYWNCQVVGGTFNLGFRNPELVTSLVSALKEMDAGNFHLTSAAQARLGKALAESTGNALPGVVYGTSGGEANDIAIRAAMLFTGRSNVVSTTHAYHGHVGYSLAATDRKFRGQSIKLIEPIRVPYNDIDALARAIDDNCAAVILEGIQNAAGIVIPNEGYLATAARICKARGACLILDEIVCGLGRTGTTWFYEQEHFTPDMITTAKGLGGGIYPVSAVLMRQEIHAVLEESPGLHSSTYAGSELGCVVAQAVLAITCTPRFNEHVKNLAAFFAAGLSDLPCSVRQRGLLIGLKFGSEAIAIGALARLLDAGIFTLPADDPSVLKFVPPLNIAVDEAEQILEQTRNALLKA